MLSLRGDTAEGAAPHGAERCIPGEDGGELGTVREKFVRHLMMSDMYNVDAMLTATEGTTLYEERVSTRKLGVVLCVAWLTLPPSLPPSRQVILFKKAGDHENALKLLVYQLSNPAEAETYCASFADMCTCSVERSSEVVRLVVESWHLTRVFCLLCLLQPRLRRRTRS